jgi:hypothetical protein
MKIIAGTSYLVVHTDPLGPSQQQQQLINDSGQTMKNKPRPLILFLLLSTFLLVCAGSAFAQRNISIDFVTVTLSSLNSPVALTSADTITVKNGGTLAVDIDGVVIGRLQIGDASTTGTVVFDNTPNTTLEVRTNATAGTPGDVVLGLVGGTLDMTTFTPHTLRVHGSFLAAPGGNFGTFNAGASTIEYASGNTNVAQNITARIGGSGATIQYKNLTLSSSGVAANTATKVFAPGVTVQGNLIIKDRAATSGSPVTYGTLASLTYAGSIAQKTSSAEWPASPTVLSGSVVVSNAAGVTLDSNKIIGAGSSASLNLVTGNLSDGGNILTVQGNIANNTAVAGTGTLVLGGSSAQTLVGTGTYGNLALNNTAGAVLPSGGLTPLVNGRLTIANGKLTLPNGSTHHTSLLTYGAQDRAAGTYGSSASSATTRDNAFFDSSASGVLTVDAKPVPTITQTLSPASITYGDPSVTISGLITPPTTPVNFATFGNGAVNGEYVTNVVTPTSGPGSPQTFLTTVVNGSYSQNISTATLPLGSYSIQTLYQGGINLAPAGPTSTTLTINKKQITVTPNNAAKTYGQPDPILTYTYSPALVDSDTFTGALSRAAGENVGAYLITQGSLAINNNYIITVVNTRQLNIVPKSITVTADAKTKVYGQSDPQLTYTFTPALIQGDSFSGSLTRAAGETVGSYAITQGTLTAGNNYAVTYVGANLVITPLATTISFNSVAKTYGDADPTFTYTANPPLAFSDAGKVTGKPSRDAGETVAGSPYTIRPGNLSLGDVAGNYNLTFSTTGKLTINKKNVTVAAQSPSMPYGGLTGGTLPALVGYTGFITDPKNGVVPPQTAPATPNTTTPATVANSCTLPATINFTVNNDAADPNYSFSAPTPAAGALTINLAPLSIIADNKSKVADGFVYPLANFTLSYNGFVCGDNAGNALTGQAQFTGAATSATAPGTYPINISSSTFASSKYNITFVQGWLSITEPPTNHNITGGATWSSGGNYTVFLNQANGTAGKNPGWT